MHRFLGQLSRLIPAFHGLVLALLKEVGVIILID